MTLTFDKGPAQQARQQASCSPRLLEGLPKGLSSILRVLSLYNMVCILLTGMMTKESEHAYGMHVLSQAHWQRQPNGKAKAMLYLLLARV